MSVSIRRLYELYQHLGKIHFLTDLPLTSTGDNEDDFRIYRYMQYTDLVLSLENRNFAFVTPERWEDGLERRYWKTDYSALNPDFQTPQFACLCVTPENHDDLAAAWKMYRREAHEKKTGDFDNNLVRLSINFALFLTELNNWAEANNSEIYVTAIDYSYGQEQIKNDLPNNSRIFPQGFGVEDYFRVLSYKRPNFAFEREMRIFALAPRKSDAGKIESGLLLLKPFDITRFITNILVSPRKEAYTKPLKAEDIRPVMRHFFPDKGSMSSFVKDCLQFDGQECKPIQRSTKENTMAEKTRLNDGSTHWINGTIEEVLIASSNGGLSIKIKGADAHISKDGKYNLYAPFKESETGEKESAETGTLNDANKAKEKAPIPIKVDNPIQVVADQTPGLLDFIRDAFFNKKTVLWEVALNKVEEAGEGEREIKLKVMQIKA